MEFENQLEIGNGIYTPSEIAKILRVTYAKVFRWIIKYWDGELGKEFAERYSRKVENSTAVSFHTLVEFLLKSDQPKRTRIWDTGHKKELFNQPKS